MSCDRCEDVHKAQKEGKTQNECKCSCHDTFTTTWTGTDTLLTTTTTGTINDTLFTYNTGDATATTFDISNNQINVTTSIDTGGGDAFTCGDEMVKHTQDNTNKQEKD